jgi:D-beta-D-heptose 7-phosphate kinase/D-beta-D-heptose 1-phosphate adenosyltransferase
VVDPKGCDYHKYVGATLVKPNLREFSDVSGKRFNPVCEGFQKELIRAAGDFLARCNIGGLLITLGEYGMLYVPSEKPVNGAIYLPTRAQEVFDVSGAGDTKIAALAAAMGAGAGMADAMQIANAAAGIVVGKLGTASVSAEELDSALSNAGVSPRRKIVSVDELQREVTRLKKQGKKIGFTNGCFDCCHLGHLTSLREARKLCDVLVVGVNSDAWIRANKGPGRPIQDEATRTALLAELECVDFVTVFGDRTALPLVRKLRPHVIAKEGYALKDWPEGRFVKSIGGKAVTLKRVDGYSTTALAERMKVS